MKRGVRFVPLLLVPLVAEAATCVNEAGESVDWWFALKYPLAASDDCAGQCYSYMTSETLTWTQSEYLVTDTTSIMGMQMADIYAQKSGLSYVLCESSAPFPHPLLQPDHFLLEYGCP